MAQRELSGLVGIQTGAQLIANSGTGLVEAPGRPSLSFPTPPQKSLRDSEVEVIQKQECFTILIPEEKIKVRSTERQWGSQAHQNQDSYSARWGI